MELTDALLKYRILPEADIVREDAVLPTLGALCSGGLPLICLDINSEGSQRMLQSALRTFADMLIVAMVGGTAQASAVIAAGARFIASPGISDEIAALCGDSGTRYIPGCMTPSDIMKARSLGLTTVMLNPVALSDDRALVAYLVSEYPKTRFIIRGNLDINNAGEYLSNPRLLGAVLRDITTGALDSIAAASREAVIKYSAGGTFDD